MSKTVQITSAAQFSSLVQSSTVVVTDFYADWCGPCKVIAPIYEQLSAQLSRPGKVTFAKVNTDQQQQIAQSHGISAMPTFLIFKAGREVHRVKGADPRQLSDAVKRLAAEAERAGPADEGSSSGISWLGADLPRAYSDITNEVDTKGLDVLNADTDFGNVRTLFDQGKPSSLADPGKGKGSAQEGKKDWMESDTDEQLMLYIPFQSSLKLHSLHITSLPPSGDDAGDDVPMRPRQLKLFTNRAHNLGFEEAEDTQATQDIEISERDWDDKTGTAKVELRFVKFQNITSVVLFVVSGLGDTEKCRIDRLRLVGETGVKRDPGKLEKIDHEH